MWKWNGVEDWKNERLAYYQQLLIERGITNPDHLANLTAQLIVENGMLTPDRIGDNGCSIGIPQYNVCANKRTNAKAFYDSNADWHDWRYQMRWMADKMANHYEAYSGDIFRVVIHHNCPACASAKRDSNAGYWRKVLSYGKLLTSSDI